MEIRYCHLRQKCSLLSVQQDVWPRRNQQNPVMERDLLMEQLFRRYQVLFSLNINYSLDLVQRSQLHQQKRNYGRTSANEEFIPQSSGIAILKHEIANLF